MNEGTAVGFHLQNVNKVERILARLDVAVQPSNLDLPGYMLHPLRGRTLRTVVRQSLRKLENRLSL